MHVALLVSVEDDPTEPDLEALDGLEILAGVFSQYPGAAFAVRFPPHLLASVSEERPEILAELAEAPIEWVRRGWGDPDPDVLPERVVELAISQETKILESLKLNPGAFWLRRRWDHRMPLVLARSGISALLVDDRLVRSGSVGVTSHLDRVLPTLRVSEAPAQLEVGSSDRVTVWRIEPTTLERAVELVARTPGLDLTTPSRYVAQHSVRGELAMRFDPPPILDPDRRLLHRRLVRVATALPERVPTPALEPLLAASYDRVWDWKAPPPLLRRAARRLVEAQRTLDQQRRGGDDWVELLQTDWDADGSDEIVVELASFAVVVNTEGRILALDDKQRLWPASHLAATAPGSICRFVLDGANGPSEPRFRVDRAEKGKGEATVELASEMGEGALRVRLRAKGRRLELTYLPDRTGPGTIGPQLVLGLPDAQLRVDGSDWAAIDRPTTVSGHRFRFGSEDQGLLVTAMVPASLELIPQAGGVLVWPHWPTNGTGTHELTIDLSG